LRISDIMSQHNASASFVVEIRKPQEEERPRTIKAYMMPIEPKDCSKVVKQLAAELPLPDALSHLKRVRNPQNQTCTSNEKKKKQKLMLQVLIGQDPSISLSFLSSTTTTTTTPAALEPVTVPGRPPKSKEEWQEFKQLWPTTFLPLNSHEHQEQLWALSKEEVTKMKQIMDYHVLPKNQVVIVDPSTFTIISSSTDEYQLQTSIIDNNPLATPILLALQGVSRMERQAASTLSNESFSKGQYLCTGYDLYAPYEPTVFEAMSSLHHRLGRVIYFSGGGGGESKARVWRNGLSQHYIHCLPGTNHRYRAFEYRIVDKTSSEDTDISEG
jgi:tRNA-specific adenosine deaminase 3